MRKWNFNTELGGAFATDLPEKERKRILDGRRKRRSDK